MSFTLLLFAMAARLANDSGMLRELETVSWGECEAIEGPIGAEDLSIDPYTQIAYIAADDRREYILTGDQEGIPNGGIWMLDLRNPASQPVKLDFEFEGVFHPHGLSLRFENKQLVELYVVNHITPTEHEIDVFTVKAPGQIEFRKRISFPEMISPNDLVTVGQDKFFMTNDHGNPRHTVMEVLEDYLGLPLANIVYFDGQEAHVVIDGLKMANGVQISEDQSSLYVAESTGRRLTRFSRGESLLDWKPQSSIKFDSSVYKIEMDGDGYLLTGSHPKAFDFLAHVKDNEALSPSEVIRFDVSGDEMQAEILYLNQGEALSGSSVAAISGNTMLIGPVFEPHFLRCQK